MFDNSASKLSTAQIDSLKRLFAASDQVVVLRVEGLRALNGAGASQLSVQLLTQLPTQLREVIGDDRALASSLASLTVSVKIKPAQDLIAQAIADHQHFFEMKLRDNDTLVKRDAAFTADINQASRKLHRAYDALMTAFPNEPAGNKPTL